MSASLEKMFVPYSVEELEKMESPYVEEIREWTESKRHLLAGNNAWCVCSILILEGSSISCISLPFDEYDMDALAEWSAESGEKNPDPVADPRCVFLSTPFCNRIEG